MLLYKIRLAHIHGAESALFVAYTHHSHPEQLLLFIRVLFFSRFLEAMYIGVSLTGYDCLFSDVGLCLCQAEDTDEDSRRFR